MSIQPYNNFSEINPSYCKDLVNEWKNSAVDGITTQGLLTLSDRTIKLIAHLNNLSEKDEKKELKNVTREAFDNLGQDNANKLIYFIVKNTIDENNGVFKIFHDLNEIVTDRKHQKNMLNNIDETAFINLQQTKSKSLKISNPDAAKLIHEQLSVDDLLSLYNTSFESYNIAKPILINRVINGKLSLRKLLNTKFRNLLKMDDIKSGKFIVDFFGDSCSKITNLDLKDLSVLENIAFLRFFPNLEELSLVRCEKISDLSPVQFLTKLKALNLQQCSNVAELSPLKFLTKLEALSLNQCGNFLLKRKIENLNFLKDLKNLRKLDIRSMYTGGIGISLKNLQFCEHLEELHLSKGEYCKFLIYCPNLQRLDLRGCNIKKQLRVVTLCKKLQKNLKELDLSHSIRSTSDLNYLYLFKNLCFLNISHNDTLTDLSFLEFSPDFRDSLQTIDLSCCFQLRDFSALIKCKNLKKLVLTHCKIPSLQYQALKDKGVEMSIIGAEIS